MPVVGTLFTFVLFTAGLLVARPAVVAQSPPAPYFPPPGLWERRAPAALGMDEAKLSDALRFAASRESTRPRDLSDQERIFGSLLGSMPTRRGATNGVIIYKGYLVGEFGDPAFVDPTYSVAKSMLSTVAGVAARHGRLRLDDPVGRTIRDGGYDSPRNALVTWKMHLQQESEWEGALWGKAHDFVGRQAFGEGERQPLATGQRGRGRLARHRRDSEVGTAS
jgi:hypothetical protein